MEVTTVNHTELEQELLAAIRAGMTAIENIEAEIADRVGDLPEKLASVHSKTAEAKESLKAVMEDAGHKTIMGQGLQATNAARKDFKVTDPIAVRLHLLSLGELDGCLKLDPKEVEKVWVSYGGFEGAEKVTRYQLGVKVTE